MREELYERVVVTLNARGEAGREPGEPVATDFPTSWDTIKPGHVVLTADTLVDGWWAAIVVARTGDKLTLRWRDYPGWPKVTVRASAVALVSAPEINPPINLASGCTQQSEVPLTPQVWSKPCRPNRTAFAPSTIVFAKP